MCSYRFGFGRGFALVGVAAVGVDPLEEDLVLVGREHLPGQDQLVLERPPKSRPFVPTVNLDESRPARQGNKTKYLVQQI